MTPAGAGTTAPKDPETTVNLAGWKKSRFHTPLLPSGSRVQIVIPDLPALIESGDIPQHLLEAALGVAASGVDTPPSVDLIKQQREFTDTLVRLTVTNPKITDEDAAELPYEDKEFLVAVATRQRDLDVEGEHLAGLTKSEKFRRFRQLREFDPALEGA